MGKHDANAHTLHIPKKDKFTQLKPAAITDHAVRAPQVPRPGRSAHNMFK